MTGKEIVDEIKMSKYTKATKLGFNILEQVLWCAACLLFISYDWRLGLGIAFFDFQFNLQRLREKWNDIHFIKRILIENYNPEDKSPD